MDIKLDYIDEKTGNNRTRTIEVRGHDDFWLYGRWKHCKTEEKYAFGRVQKCIDISTGEKIEDLKSYLSSRGL